MGGNVFQTKSRRYSKEEYIILEAEVIDKLSSIFVKTDEITCRPLRYYSSKDSFGDMDIITNTTLLLPNWIPVVIEVFSLGHGEWSKNGNVLSFLYKEFQIDLIGMVDYNFDTAYDYYAYNDLSNLIGRISHKHGIKFGHDGSWITLRNGDYKIGDILVTKSTKDLFEYLELDYNHWNSGFDTIDEMFTWVSATRFFNKEIYSLDNRNHYSRTRDKKRANYAGFLEWIADRDLPNYPYQEVTSKDGYNIREPYFTEICKRWSHVGEEYQKLLSKEKDREKFKEVFNGSLVMEISGLAGKELGGFMDYCRTTFSEEPTLKDAYIISSELIRHRIIKSLLWHHNKGFTFAGFTVEEYHEINTRP